MRCTSNVKANVPYWSDVLMSLLQKGIFTTEITEYTEN
jgi:hypothetical protein